MANIFHSASTQWTCRKICNHALPLFYWNSLICFKLEEVQDVCNSGWLCLEPCVAKNSIFMRPDRACLKNTSKYTLTLLSSLLPERGTNRICNYCFFPETVVLYSGHYHYLVSVTLHTGKNESDRLSMCWSWHFTSHKFLWVKCKEKASLDAGQSCCSRVEKELDLFEYGLWPKSLSLSDGY